MKSDSKCVLSIFKKKKFFSFLKKSEMNFAVLLFRGSHWLFGGGRRPTKIVLNDSKQQLSRSDLADKWVCSVNRRAAAL